MEMRLDDFAFLHCQLVALFDVKAHSNIITKFIHNVDHVTELVVFGSVELKIVHEE